MGALYAQLCGICMHICTSMFICSQVSMFINLCTCVYLYVCLCALIHAGNNRTLTHGFVVARIPMVVGIPPPNQECCMHRAESLGDPIIHEGAHASSPAFKRGYKPSHYNRSYIHNIHRYVYAHKYKYHSLIHLSVHWHSYQHP